MFSLGQRAFSHRSLDEVQRSLENRCHKQPALRYAHAGYVSLVPMSASIGAFHKLTAPYPTDTWKRHSSEDFNHAS